jgi:hypothetical protein
MTKPQLVQPQEPCRRRTRSNANIHHAFVRVAAMIGLSISAVVCDVSVSNAHPSPTSAPTERTLPQTERASRPATRRPYITFVGRPTPKASDTIAWAIDRYRSAGLQLPDLTVSFPTFCAGKAALYHVGRRSIDFCFISRRTVLHEFAHAWDDTSGAVDREGFLALRGLRVWRGDTNMPDAEQGSEQLAQIVAWGLMDAETRGVPQLPANSVSELTRAFTMLTGGVKPRQPTPALARPS